MSTEQPEAMRLAAGLDDLFGYRGIDPDVGKAASELRRLHQITINQSHEMRLLLEALIVVQQEAIRWYAESRGFDPETDKHPDWLVQSDAAIAEATKE
ncbi:MAG: hypothetical protein AN484_11955 [Aphanizomenon flos-aquae WA102]|uniref:Uncharacterized protein n=1 Tax=Aphanizomenon flos-aquae WA102 TaxID=1710896 RepID=A0A1B7X2E1_APHFL|nr:MAG: hypothetical protein AN484_11955 [Aphanizomenon flos-aquae WA102]